MAVSEEVRNPTGEGKGRERAGIVLAFLAIYILWGSTYFAIRVAVETVPPILAAGLRFTLAGLALAAWAGVRGTAMPARVEWRNLTLLGVLLFLIPYSGLFWAEKTVPSGIASVLVATIPITTALLQILVMRKESFRWPLVISLLLGFGGVALLALHPSAGQGSPLAYLVVLVCSFSWSAGTVVAKSAALPDSKILSAGIQMVVGGVLLLTFSMVLGELQPLPQIGFRAGIAIAYLITAGSIVAFTSYLWLLGRMPATTVTSYAYVNPVVALLLGHWMGQEELGGRTLAGAALVVVSVLLITRGQSR